MKKRILTIATVACLIIGMVMFMLMTTTAAEPTVWDGTVAKAYASGSGTAADPYIINAPAQFAYFASRVNTGNDLTAHVKLGADLLFNTGDAGTWKTTAPLNSGLQAVGWETQPFAGVFDGDGHTISGLYVTSSLNGDRVVVGLFGCTNNATVKNFLLTNSYFGVNRWSGGVIGEAQGNTTVQNVYCDVYVHATEVADKNGTVVGGIVGGIVKKSNLTVENCVFAGTVISETTTVNSNQAFVGGILGMGGAERTATIKNCLNFGRVEHTKGMQYIGGFVGKHDNTITIENCINAMAPTSSSTTGITDLWAGKLSDAGVTATITNCIYVGETAFYLTPDSKGTLAPTNIIKTTIGELVGTASAVDTAVFTAWTPRANDIIIPTGVSTFAPASGLEIVKTLVTTAIPEETTTAPPEVTTTIPEETTTTAPEETTTAAPEETTAARSEETTKATETTEVPAKKGCNSSISGALITTLIITPGTGIFVFRKKRI